MQENQERHLLEEKAEERRRQRAQQMNAKQLSLRTFSSPVLGYAEGPFTHALRVAALRW